VFETGRGRRFSDGELMRTYRRDAAIEPQDSEAGSKAVLRKRPAGEGGGDECLGVGPGRRAPRALRSYAAVIC
jgi:hypothetical protein